MLLQMSGPILNATQLVTAPQDAVPSTRLAALPGAGGYFSVLMCLGYLSFEFDFGPPVPLLRPVFHRKLNCARPLIICAEPHMVMVLNHAQPRIDAYEMKHHSFVAPSEIVLEYSPLTPVPAHPSPSVPPPPLPSLSCSARCDFE